MIKMPTQIPSRDDDDDDDAREDTGFKGPWKKVPKTFAFPMVLLPTF